MRDEARGFKSKVFMFGGAKPDLGMLIYRSPFCSCRERLIGRPGSATPRDTAPHPPQCRKKTISISICRSDVLFQAMKLGRA
jgi:hypothetical protein